MRVSLGITLSLIIAASCVKIPLEEAKCSLQPIPSLDQTIDTALQSSHFYERDFPKGDWWEMFSDPQLTRLIRKSLACNPSLQVAEERIRQAEAQAKIKKSFLLPTIGFGAKFAQQYFGKNDFFRAYTSVIPGNVPEYEIEVDFAYEIDFWGKNRNIFRSALSLAKAQEAERQHAIVMLSTSVAAVYFKFQANRQKLEILYEEQKVIKKLLELTKERKENALDNSIQILAAEEQLFLLNKNILILRQMIDLNIHTLHLLLGEGPDTCEEITSISLTASPPFPLPTHISSNLLARRPDLMAYIWRVESAAHLVGAAKADFYPRVDLSGLAGIDSVFLNKLFTWPSRAAAFVPAIHLPIFTAGRLKANLAEKQAEFRELIYAYNDAVLHAVKEVADQIVILRAADEEYKVEEMLVVNKLENKQIVAQRYEYAIANSLDLLQAEEALLKQEFMKIEFQYKRYLTAIHLIKALGGGYCTEEIPFERGTCDN